MTPLPDDAELTPAEVAALCGVCVHTVWKWTRQGTWDGCRLACRPARRVRDRATTAGDLRRFLKEAGRPVPPALRRWRVAGDAPPGPAPDAAAPAPGGLAPAPDPTA